jgi:hypothetical protein
MECRRNFSNFERFTPSGASELLCESSGVEARTSSLQKAFSQVWHFFIAEHVVFNIFWLKV